MPTDSLAFDRAVEFYDQTRGFPGGREREAAQLIVQVGALTAQSRVLEVGVGTGRIALPLAPHVGEYVGIDISRPMMLKLRGKQSDERIDLSEADARVLPFADASFDAVVAVHIFHLIPNWQQALIELKRVLKPEGVLLHGWNRQDDSHVMQQFWQRTENNTASVSGGLSFDRRNTFLTEVGWSLLGEGQFAYTFDRAPIEYVNDIRNRISSRYWSMNDDEVVAKASELESFLLATYTDLTQILPVPSSFHVQKYAPPAV